MIKIYIKNSYLTLVYRLLILLLSGISIISHLSLTNSKNNSKMLAYFTIQSVIFVFIIYLILVIYTILEIKNKKIAIYRFRFLFLKGMCTLAIIITFLSYQFMLKDTGFSMYMQSGFFSAVKDSTVHFIIPMLVVFDWLLFTPKGTTRWYYCITWLAFPFSYICVILFRGLTFADSYFYGIPKYPYFFLNVDYLGIKKVLLCIAIYLVFIIFIGLLMFLCDTFISFIDNMFITPFIIKLKQKHFKK